MNYTKNDMVQSLRKQSDMARPSQEFTSDLKDKLMSNVKKRPFWMLPQYKVFLPLILLFVAVFAVGGVSLLRNSSKVTVPGNNGDSPLLNFLGISGEATFQKGDNYLERTGEEGGDSEDGGAEFYADMISEKSDGSPAVVDNRQGASLKGGEIDDNVLFDDFLKYVEEMTHDVLTRGVFEDRYMIEIVDSSGNGVLGQVLTITDSNGQVYKLVTDSDGQIFFFPKMYAKTSQQSTNAGTPSHYRIKIGDKEMEYKSDERKWSIELDGVVDNTSGLTLDLVFTIDTTGSMSDQINRLKETIDKISENVSKLENAPKIRYGMVIYRDKTDQYITRVYDFTEDLSKFRANLEKVEASGGGDYPEDVNTALKDTMEQLSWSTDKNTVRLAFLVADAPPHNDYGQEYDYKVASLRAMELGVKIYPLASSGLDNTEGELIFRQLAITTNASYIFITNASGGTDYHVDEQSYSVSALDELITNVIKKEIDGVR